MIHSKAIIGVNMLRVSDQRPLVLKRCLDAVVQLALSGELTPTVGGRFTVGDIAKAHAFLEGRGSMGKVVVTWNP